MKYTGIRAEIASRYSFGPEVASSRSHQIRAENLAPISIEPVLTHFIGKNVGLLVAQDEKTGAR